MQKKRNNMNKKTKTNIQSGTQVGIVLVSKLVSK
jgi:hypothetical protein